MAKHDEELLHAARLLLTREEGQRGRLASAYVRRSISTSYYALFHFLLEEVTSRAAGSSNDLRVRRRMLARVVTHRGLKTALDKIKGNTINASVSRFFERNSAPVAAAPPFARGVANVFLDAQTKREAADYDLNEPLSEEDARVLRLRVRRVIRRWREAGDTSDKDFKHALSILILLKGQLRQDQN